jgi:hypothetical protein
LKKPNRTEPNRTKKTWKKTEPNRKNRAKTVWTGFCPKKTELNRTETGRFEPVSVFFLISVWLLFFDKNEPNRKWSPLAWTLLKLNRITPQGQLYLDKSDFISVLANITCCIMQNISLFHKSMATCFSAYKNLYNASNNPNGSPYVGWIEYTYKIDPNK